MGVNQCLTENSSFQARRKGQPLAGLIAVEGLVEVGTHLLTVDDLGTGEEGADVAEVDATEAI